MAIRIRVLGPLEVVGDEGALVRLPGPRESALLALLAGRYPRAAETDEVVEGLWGPDPPAGAERTVRAYVSTLRAALRAGGLEGVIDTRRGGYALSAAAGEWLDAHVFEALIAHAERLKTGDGREARMRTLEAALGLWRGPALVEVATAPCVASYATYLEEARLHALEELVEARLECGEHAAVADELASLCTEQPLRERLWRARMLALYRCGRQADALTTYREARRHFRQQLGIEPGEALRALELQILRHDRSLELPDEQTVRPDRGALAPLPPALRAPVPGAFVGRSGELDALEVSWALAADGAGQLVLICGEPGIGKSTLLGLFAERVRSRGATVLAGRCDPDAPAPYQPFRDAIRPLLSAPEHLAAPEGLGPLFPALAHSTRRDDPATARLELFDALGALVLAAAARAPVVLVLEDLHWAETSSLLLLRHLARRAGPARLLILGSFRDTETGGALHEALADLHLDPGFTTLALRGLVESEVVALIAAVSGPPAQDPSRLGAMLHRATGGNPLFVRQMLAHLAIAPEAFIDSTGAPRANPPLPAGVRDVIARRLALLGGEAVDVLSLAAVIGTGFELELLEDSAGERADVLAVLERAQRAGLIVELPAGVERFRFAHELVRQSLYGTKSRARRARLHEQVGEALERLAGDDVGSVAALAQHFAAAARRGRTAKAVGYALSAGRQALSQLAFAEAATIAERGLECLALEPRPDLERRCELRLLLAEARLLARDIAACKQAAAEAGEDARGIGSPDKLARAAIIASQLNIFGQPSQSTDSLCKDALAAIGQSDPVARSQILAGWADYLASSAGDAPGAARLSDRALATARRCGDPTALSRALYVHGEVLDYGPRTQERLALAEELLNLAVARRDPHAEANACHIRALARLQEGDLAGFDADATRIEQLRKRIDYWYTDMFALLWRGMRALLDGRLDDVEPHANELLAHARHEPNVINLYVGQLIWLRRQQRRLGELRSVVKDAIHHNPQVPSFRCAMAIIHSDLGEPQLASEQLHHLASNEFATLPRDATWTTSLALLADVTATVGDQQHAHTLSRLLAPYQGQLIVATKGMLCLGAADRYLGMLAAVTTDWERADRFFQAAITLEQRIGAHTLLEQTKAAYARALLTHS